MNDLELLSILDNLREDAIGSEWGDLDKEREEALDFYHGRPVGPLAPPDGEDRSRIVDRTTMETVEWILPSLIKIFLSDDVIQFDPVGPQDEEQARQESMIVNHLFQKEGGFMILYTWMKDCLLQRNSYIHTYFDDTSTTTVEEYSGLDENDLFELDAQYQGENLEYEIVEQDFDEVTGLVDLKIRVTDRNGAFRAKCIPPEGVRVSSRPFDRVQECHYIGYETLKTRSDLIQEGYDEDTVNSLPKHEENLNNGTAQARNTLTEEDHQDSYHEPMDEIEVYVEFLRVDYDGDGIAELRKVISVDGKILENEETDLVEMAYLTAVPMPHRHVGLSMHELLKDLVQIRTMLLRQFVDNVVNVNNPGLILDENTINVSDAMMDRPGRVIRGNGDVNNAYGILQVPDISGRLIGALEWTGSLAERRSGGQGQSLSADADVLKKSTKGAFVEGISAANQRVEAIARIFAETGIREMFLNFHALMVKHQGFRKLKKIRDQWVKVDPREWKKRDSLTINVGLGNTSQEQRLESLLAVADAQERAAQAGIVQPQNVYNLAEDITRALGFQVRGRYFTDPANLPPPQPAPNPLAEVEQIKQQGRQQSDQLKAQIQMLQKQIDVQQDAQEFALRARDVESQIEAREIDSVIKLEGSDRDDVRQAEEIKRAIDGADS